jgi:hypothetical protein
MRILALAALLALSACATGKDRFVTVPCVTPEQWQELHEAEPPKVGKKLTGEADKDVKIVAGSAVRLRSWGNGLLGVLGGCRG